MNRLNPPRAATVLPRAEDLRWRAPAGDWRAADGVQARAGRLFWPLVSAVVVLAFLRVALTWGVLSQTYDEPAHLATGLQWWQDGAYTIEALHPPLARVAMALGPWLDGARTIIPDAQPDHDIFSVGTRALGSFDTYWRRLTLARAGTLPFLGLGILAVALWGRALGGPALGLAAAAIFSLIPPVLAHGGIATTDMASAATFALAAFAFHAWLRRPDMRRSLVLGLCTGAAVSSKFLALVNLPIAAAAILVLAWDGRGAARPGLVLRNLGIAALVTALFVWAIYRFDLGPLGPGLAARKLAAPGDFMWSVPAPQFWLGLADAFMKNEGGNSVYVLGRPLAHAVWYFFPVALFFKTPLAVTMLAAVGGLATLARARTARAGLIPLGVCLLGLSFLMMSNINLGVRHALQLYPFIALLAGMGLFRLVNLGGVWARGLAVLAAAGLAISSLAAHPDYLSYFNVAAGRHPEKVLIDSDLDWGQDMGRLARAMDADPEAYAQAEIFDFSMVDLGALTAVPNRQIGYTPPGWRPSGRIAISIGRLLLEKGFHWLAALDPVARIGTSILVYDVPEATSLRELPRTMVDGPAAATVEADSGVYGPYPDDPAAALAFRQKAVLTVFNPAGHAVTATLDGLFRSAGPAGARLVLNGDLGQAAPAPPAGSRGEIRLRLAPGLNRLTATVQGPESGVDRDNRPYALTLEHPRLRLGD